MAYPANVPICERLEGNVKIVINADDFALRENMTLAICECFRHRLITQTTVMVNTPFFRQSVEMAKAEGVFDRIGLHLNLTYGFPLTDDIKRSRLFCNPDGSFSAAFHLSRLYRLWLPRFERAAVAKEIEAQMGRYVEAGFSLMHLDSHHHSHTDVSIAAIAVPLAERLGFRSIRLSRNLGVQSQCKRLYKKVVNHRFVRSTLTTCDYFAGGLEDVERLLDDPGSESATLELMTHPRYLVQNGEFVASYDRLYDFNIPISVLEDLVRRMRDRGVAFATFGELK